MGLYISVGKHEKTKDGLNNVIRTVKKSVSEILINIGVIYLGLY